MQYLPVAPDVKVLALWPDPVAQAAFRAVDSAFQAVAQRGAAALEQDHRLAHPTSLALVVDRLRHDFGKLHKLCLVSIRYFKRPLWPVVASDLRRQLADVTQRLHIDVSLLHSAIPFSEPADSELVALCAGAFQIHRSEYSSMRSDAKRMLLDLTDSVREQLPPQRLGKLTGSSGVQPHQQLSSAAATLPSLAGGIIITDDLPEYAAILQRYHNGYLDHISRAAVPSESVGYRQRCLMGRQFASPLVGAVSCFQSMLREVDEYRKQLTQLNSTLRAGTALEDLSRAVTLLFQQTDSAIASGSEAALWCNAFSNTAREILSWLGNTPSLDVSTAGDPGRRTALPTTSAASRGHVAGQLVSLAALTVDCNKAFGELREDLGLLEESCEFLLSAVGQVRHSQSAALFPLAHGVATLLRDIRTLGAVLAEEAVRFYTFTVPQSADDAVEPPTCDEVLCHIFAHLPRPEGGASVAATLRLAGQPLIGCRDTVSSLASIVATVRLSVSPVAPSLQILRQSLADHRQTVTQEAAKNEADGAAVEAIVSRIQQSATQDISRERPSILTVSDDVPLSDRLDRAREELRVTQASLKSSRQDVTNDNEAILDDDVIFVGDVVGAVLDEASKLRDELASVLSERQALDDPGTERFLEAMDGFTFVMDNLCPIVLSGGFPSAA